MDKLRNYEGNEEEFKKYNEILKKRVKGKILFHYNKIKKYEGNIVNNLYDGRGILYNESGEIIYNGFFKEGKYEGFGKKYEQKQLIYEGFFLNDKYEGKGIKYDKGDKNYEGYFHEGKYHGIGIQFFNGKKIKKTYFENGYSLSKCYGILYDNNIEVYSGELLDDKPKQGKNLTEYDYLGNKLYKGDFLNFKYHGEGTRYFNYGNKIFFTGIFENGLYINGKLFDLDGKITYDGKFIDKIPIEGKNIKLYDINNKDLKYEGDILNCKYHGKGKLNNGSLFYDGEFKDGIFHGFGKLYQQKKLYYEGNFENGEIIGKGIKYYNNGNKHIIGNFVIKNRDEKFNFYFKKNYAKGILYDNKGNYICETEFIDFIPKEGKNIKLYISDEFLVYDGDIFDYKYHGKGKLYEKKKNEYFLKYDGDFYKGIFEGYGKLYKKYYKGEYYEGNFINGKIFGNGIRFYTNGQKKLEGYFEPSNNIFKGKYYSPKGNLIYKGTIENDFFYNSDIFEIYNNDGYLLYKSEIENKEKISDNFQLLKNVILCRDKILNNYYIDINLEETEAMVSFTSENYSGKTAIIERLINNTFYSGFSNILNDIYLYDYEYNNNKYKLILIQSGGNERFNSIKKQNIKRSNIIIYVVDLLSTLYDGINEDFIYDIIYENIQKSYKFIYLVISKFDAIKENIDLIETTRNHAKKLILEGVIYRYFEVSAKTGEGFDEFKNCLKFDFDLSLKLDISNPNLIYNLGVNPNIPKSKKNKKKETIKDVDILNIYKFSNLNKFLNY